MVQFVAHFNQANQSKSLDEEPDILLERIYNGHTPGELIYLYKQTFPDDESRKKKWVQTINRVARIVNENLDCSTLECDHLLFVDDESINNDDESKAESMASSGPS